MCYTLKYHIQEGVLMKITSSKKFDFNKLNYASKPITFQEATKNIDPIHWTKEVLAGEKKDQIIIRKKK